jgi:hypothetical protein
MTFALYTLALPQRLQNRFERHLCASPHFGYHWRFYAVALLLQMASQFWFWHIIPPWNGLASLASNSP